MRKLLRLAKRLRHPVRGCPWDLKQDLRSFRNNPAKEAREIRDAILKGDMPNLCEEIGDTLWNLVFLITLAEERGLFTASDVREGIHRKMVHRHPHVFGKRRARDAEEALRIFLRMKRKEPGKRAYSPSAGSSSSSPQRSSRRQRRVSRRRRTVT